MAEPIKLAVNVRSLIPGEIGGLEVAFRTALSGLMRHGERLDVTLLTNQGGDQAGTEGHFVATTIGTAFSGKGLAPVLADVSPLNTPNPGDVGDGDLDLILVWYQDKAAGSGATEEDFATFLASHRDVHDVDEVPGLPAVAEDRGGLARETADAVRGEFELVDMGARTLKGMLSETDIIRLAEPAAPH